MEHDEEEVEEYEHPMIGNRKVLGEVTNKNVSKTVTKCNRL